MSVWLTGEGINNAHLRVQVWIVGWMHERRLRCVHPVFESTLFESLPYLFLGHLSQDPVVLFLTVIDCVFD